MRIGFRLSVDDYVAFNVYHVRSSPSYRRGLIVWGLMVPLGLFVVLSVLGFKESPVFSIVSAAIPSGLLILWAWGGNDGRLRKSAQKMYSEGENRGLGGLEYLEATEDRLISVDELCESRMVWRMVERLVDTPDYYFIYISAVKELVVPKLKIEEGDFGAFQACRGGAVCCGPRRCGPTDRER